METEEREEQVRQEAEEEVSADTCVKPVPDGAQVDYAFERPKGFCHKVFIEVFLNEFLSKEERRSCRVLESWI
jgi:hypothetical protein